MLAGRARAAWLLYDVGSSSYALLITAVVFPVYFKLTIAENASWSDGLWGALLALSSICAGLLGPLLGSAADRTGHRRQYLARVTAVSATATLALAIPDLGLAVSAAVFCISLISYYLAAGLYDALLKGARVESSITWTSSLGWGLGYAGGLACYAFAAFVTARSGVPLASGEAILVTGLFYTLLCAVSVLGLRNIVEPVAQHAPRSGYVRHLVNRRAWQELDIELRCKLIGTGLVSGAAVTIGLFSPLLFVSHYGLTSTDVGLLGAVFSVVSIFSTVGLGYLASRYGAFQLLVCLFPVWLLVAALLVSATGWAMGLVTALCLGLGVGPTHSLARALACNAASEQHSAELLGYAALFNRLAGAVGPLFFGVLSSASGGRWLPLALAAGVMLSGYMLLLRQAPWRTGTKPEHQSGS